MDTKRKLGVMKISIHAPRTGSDLMDTTIVNLSNLISIHAPRTGSDKTALKGIDGCEYISIHAPRTGSDRQDVRCP